MRYYNMQNGKFRRSEYGLATYGPNESWNGILPTYVKNLLGHFYLFEDSRGNTSVCTTYNGTLQYYMNSNFTLNNDYVFENTYCKIHYTRDNKDQISIWFEKPNGSVVRYGSIRTTGPFEIPSQFDSNNVALTMLVFKTASTTNLLYQESAATSSNYHAKLAISWKVGMGDTLSEVEASTSAKDFGTDKLPYNGDCLNVSPVESATSVGMVLGDIDSLVGNLKNKYISR